MRLNRPGPHEEPRRPGDGLDLAAYGLPDLPALDPALPGEIVESLARAYVDGLDLGSSVRRGMILFRAECALDDDLREREGRPSFEDEILGEL